MLDKLNFGKINLDNLKIRNKLIALLFVPLLALVFFAFMGYDQRSSTAERATDDEHIVNAAAATSGLVAAMLHEAVARTAALSKVEVSKAELQKVDTATDRAITTFTDANDRLGLSDDSDAGSQLATLEATIESFKGYRTQPQDTWYEQLDRYRSGTIDKFIDYVQAMSGLTTSPEVVLPLEQLAATLNYNLQTVALSTMASTTRADGSGAWFDEAARNDPANKGQRDLDNRQRVYDQIVTQDKTNAVLVAIAGGSSPITSDFNQNVKMPTELNTVLQVDWQVPPAMSGTAFAAPEDELQLPSDVVSLAEVQGYADQLGGVSNNLTERTTHQIESSRNSAERSARLYLLGGGLVIIAAIAAAIWISRSITQRLVKLTGAADRLSHEQLPRLVDSLKNPAEDDVGYLTSSFSEIDVQGRDEIGQLAGAFNGIQGVAVQVATEQAQLLRKGIGEMFVNLARRNQGLLDRQIEFIDQLESAEEDPDQLENLFRLDHLATRMRRNAESLLVLAGAEPSRRRGKPVPLADVVRAAVGEVEDFARIDMLQFDEVLVASNAALDIAHLLSELMENAANFSPPDTRVEVVGHRTKAEGYVISVTDHGIGMSPEALAESNDLLARPPLVGLALSRSLGFIVIGRLAARFGIAVRLMPSPSSGTTAMVSLPPSLITDQPRSATGPAELGERPSAARATDDPVALADGTDRRPPPRRVRTVTEPEPTARPTGPAVPPEPTPRAPAGAMPRRRPGAAGVPPREPVAATPEPASPTPSTGTTTALRTDAAPPAEATSAGLTKRVPRSAGGQRAVPGGDGKRAATQNRRSPEEVRSMLSSYRSGMQKGRSDEESPTAADGHEPEDGAN